MWRTLASGVGFLLLWFLYVLPTRGEQFLVPVSASESAVAFDYRRPVGTNVVRGVLLLVPGFNGSGMDLLNGSWASFADTCGLVLLAPTFHSSGEEVHHRQGYYYPELWSGATVETALAELAKREKVPVDRILIFGFSAGAHFAHRFALWKPERVKAFVAYSAGWWDAPTCGLTNVPALIMCGEKDARLPATREFMERGIQLGLPFVWRSYRDVGHTMTPAVQRKAEAFLRHYAVGGTDEPLIGDLQTYRVVSLDQANSIPSAVRINLPSKDVAAVWMKEE